MAKHDSKKAAAVFFLLAILSGNYFLPNGTSADTSNATLTVENSLPSVSSVSISTSSIVLTENTTTTVTITATITDADGCSTVFDDGTITATFYRSGVSGGTSCTADNSNCYRSLTLSEVGGSCTGGADTAGSASGTANLWYFAEPTDADSLYPSQNWIASVKAVDSSNGSSTATSSAELLSLYALVAANISYGNIAAGFNTESDNKTVSVYNTGNYKIDAEVSGTDMSSGGNTLGVANQKYGTSSVDYSSLLYALSSTATTRNLDILKATTTGGYKIDTYWGIAIPSGQTSGSYSGTNTFTAVKSDD